MLDVKYLDTSASSSANLPFLRPELLSSGSSRLSGFLLRDFDFRNVTSENAKSGTNQTLH